MHILHLIDGLGLGGAERMLIDLANQAARDGHRVSVCVTRRTVTLAHELDPRVALKVLGRTRRISPIHALRFAAWTRRARVDVVHVHMRSNLLFVLPLRAARLVRAPLVFHDHYGTIELDASTPAWFRWGRRWIGRYVGVHERLAEWARAAGMRERDIEMIPNAIDLARPRSTRAYDLRGALGAAPALPLGVLVAALRPDKAVDMLLDAVARSSSRGRSAIAIVGNDNDRVYADARRAQCRALGLESTVTFLGPRADIPDVLAAADFALLSSRTESGPLVLLEYLAAGLPIVSTRVGNIGHQLARAGVPGFVAPDDAAAFAAALDQLLALSPTARHARGEAGRCALGADFDLTQVMPRWYAVYADSIADQLNGDA